jgi:hypothetical protein
MRGNPHAPVPVWRVRIGIGGGGFDFRGGISSPRVQPSAADVTTQMIQEEHHQGPDGGAHNLPTIRPQLQSSPMMSSDEVSLLGGLFKVLPCAVRRVQS